VTFVPRPRAPTAQGAYKNAKPIEIDGITYASISAAARALKISRTLVRTGRSAPSHGGGSPRVPCFGFASMSEAAKTLKMDIRTIKKAITEGRAPVPDPRPKSTGPRKRVGRFGTIKAAADSIGVSPACVAKRIRLGQNPFAKPRGQSAEKYTKAIPSSAPSVAKSASRSSPLKSIGDKIPGGQSEENR
jgi:hypothetical protein